MDESRGKDERDVYGRVEGGMGGIVSKRGRVGRKKERAKEARREGREVSWISGAVLQRDTSAF